MNKTELDKLRREERVRFLNQRNEAWQEIKQLRQELDEWKAKAERWKKALQGIAEQPEVDEGSEGADGVANYCIEEARETLEEMSE